MNISYTISVYNEIDEIQKLLSFLSKSIDNNDEIILLHTYRDHQEQHEEWFINIKNLCHKYCHIYENFHFKNNFAVMKNTLNSFATKEFIINLDADEIITADTLSLWKQIIRTNNNDLFLVPRINIVSNYTIDDMKKYSWSINNQGWINWPDYQPRIYKNFCDIRWQGSVHEQLANYKNAIALLPDPKLAIIHDKSIEKQRQQNTLYETIAIQ